MIPSNVIKPDDGGWIAEKSSLFSGFSIRFGREIYGSNLNF
jgi:hypothetical protein